jgi:hypothetical protein
MVEQFKSIIYALIKPNGKEKAFSIFDPTGQFDEGHTDNAGIAQALNAAFLITLAGNRHPESGQAKRFLIRMADSPEWADVAGFYINGISLVYGEIESVSKHDTNFADRLKNLSNWMLNKENLNNIEKTAEKIWSVFFPEANGIHANIKERIEALRTKRTVTITELNTTPITDPARQILFTSNVLLTIPPALKSLDELPLSNHLKEKLLEITHEPQLYWYDHPIQIGVEQEKNEVLYGIRGLEAAFESERDRGNTSPDAKATCVLSVSSTHRGSITLSKSISKKNSPAQGACVYVFTEVNTQQIIDEVLAPATAHYLQHKNANELLSVLV